MIFRRAKLRLTLWFAIAQLVLFGAFALAVYAYATSAFDFDQAESDIATAENGFANLRTGLLLAYAALAVVVPLTSYGLASLAIRPLRQGYEAQQRFVDDASHEFRTPLAAVQAQLELGLARPRTAAEYRTAMTRSLDAVGRLNGMIDELLLLSRGPLPTSIPLRPVSLRAAVIDARDSLSDGDRVLLAAGEDVMVMAVPTMLARAILNLLSNALRYSATNAPVTVTVTRHGRLGRVSVNDEGLGMSRRELRRAAERYWRADSSRASVGSGLGLSIVVELLRLQRGRLRLESTPGAGTTASVELPLSR